MKDNHKISVETNIFDFKGDIYGKSITVSLIRFIREEKKFGSVEELKARIGEDIACAKEYTGKKLLTVGAL